MTARFPALFAGLLVALLWAAALPTGPAAAQDTQIQALSPADAAAIRGTIQSQLDAFRRDDAPGAYRHAAPNIQSMFPNPAAFMDMVRRGYAPVYRPRSIEFGAPERRNGIIVEDVELVGPDGRPVTAAYTLERDAEGNWRITGCSLLPSARLST